MESLKTLLAREGYYVVSYRDFCVNKQNKPNTVNNRIQQLQAEIKDKFVTLIRGLKEKEIPGPYEGKEVVLNYPDLDISLGAITKEDSIIHLSGYQRLRR